jgi:hypothetical protein
MTSMAVAGYIGGFGRRLNTGFSRAGSVPRVNEHGQAAS